MPCIFCTLQTSGAAFLCETDDFRVRLDIHPVTPGHMILIPKRHEQRFGELTSSEVTGLFYARGFAKHFLTNMAAEKLSERYRAIIAEAGSVHSAAYIQNALSKPWFGLRPQGWNHASNEGECAGQTLEHCHEHLYPRYPGDMEDPVGGVRAMFPGMGNYNKAPR